MCAWAGGFHYYFTRPQHIGVYTQKAIAYFPNTNTHTDVRHLHALAIRILRDTCVRNVPSVHGFVCATVGLTIAYTRKCTIQYMYCITLHICSIYADICLIVPYAPICMWQVFDAARCWRSELVGHNGIITIKRRRAEWRQRQRLDLFASVQAATPATHIYIAHPCAASRHCVTSARSTTHLYHHYPGPWWWWALSKVVWECI